MYRCELEPEKGTKQTFLIRVRFVPFSAFCTHLRFFKKILKIGKVAEFSEKVKL